MKNVVVTAATRTAIGTLGGSFIDVLPESLATHVIKSVIRKSKISEDEIDSVVFGQTKQSSDAPNIARVALLMARLPEEIPAYTIHMQCSSGMQAIIDATMQIQTNNSEVVIAGGVESMSKAPYYLRNARYGYNAGNSVLVDSNTESQPKAQPEDIYGTFNMGMTAENLAEKYNISRQEQDEFALSSQQKAINAIDEGRFKEEIEPITIKRKKESLVFDTDEYPRRDTSLEKLGKLKPVFKKEGTVTAGNSSGRNDGASAMMLMSEEKATELGIRPLVRVLSSGAAGVDPRIMGIGPVPAIKKALNKAGLDISDIGLIELNEAFAAQSIAVVKELNLNDAIVNVNGGAIALGHPLGSSGNRICVTLIHEMIKRKIKYGLATLCVAGGLGEAVIFENLSL